MEGIKIFSDSTCDLSKEEVNRMDIGIVPLTINFEEKLYKEGLDINTGEVLGKVKELGVLPKTSAPSPAEFYEAFKPYVEKGDSIIYIGLSSKISSTVSNAIIAKNMFDNNENIYVIDSLNLCGGIGGLVRIAYNFLEEGCPIEETVKNVEKILHKYKLFFTMDKLDYLYKGGRCSGMQFVLGSTFGVKPIIEMTTDGLGVWKKTRGKKKAIELMLEEAERDKDKIYNDEIHIAAITGSEKELENIKEELIKRTGITKFHEYSVGCTIASHCGEGTVGFGYFLK
ncbi:DegV family protein [Peptacetobacter sp.]|uniref:DegV family protein n=1 Tax=Peptacetobacter sp. TaxID=2991975 RepID=UPI00261B653E|nr:DegV family protein [Peptacetobacter sp.]